MYAAPRRQREPAGAAPRRPRHFPVTRPAGTVHAVTGAPIEEITPNNGAVVREGLKKIAVFRDEAGELHRYSAVCPHLGCIVGWNPAESTWDCPCHGSRFDKRGAVLNGPANRNLEPVEE